MTRTDRNLQIEVTASTGRPLVPFLKRRINDAAPYLSADLRELSIVLVGDATMSRLHKEYLDITGPTDVLTFELDHSSNDRVISGEVVVCVPYARREAKRRKIDVRHELLLYALHGALHLSGYDDRTPQDHKRMHRREDIILKHIGIGPVFSRSLSRS